MDFEASRITATQVVTIKRAKDATTLILDVDNLDIKGVWIGRSSEGPWGKAVYESKAFTSYGQALHITLPGFAALDGNGGAAVAAAFELLYIKVSLCVYVHL